LLRLALGVVPGLPVQLQLPVWLLVLPLGLVQVLLLEHPAGFAD
jgi:hypothetical protein